MYVGTVGTLACRLGLLQVVDGTLTARRQEWALISIVAHHSSKMDKEGHPGRFVVHLEAIVIMQGRP